MWPSHCRRTAGPQLPAGVDVLSLTSGRTVRPPRYAAGVLAAVAAEFVFVTVEMLMHTLAGKSPLDPVKMPAVLIIGSESLPTSNLITSRLEIGILMHVVLSVLVGILYAASVQRLDVHAVGGGVATGLILYLLAFYVFPSTWFVWFADWNVTWTRKAVEALAHGGYGFVLGLVYIKLTRAQKE